MKKYFAFAKSDNSFIVSAPSREELTTKINEIAEKHRDYYKKFIETGYFVVAADNLGEAKMSKERELIFDLPLFQSAPPRFQLITWDDVEDEGLLIEEFSTLREALLYSRDNPQDQQKIVLLDEHNEVLKTLYQKNINKALEELSKEDRDNRRQITLF